MRKSDYAWFAGLAAAGPALMYTFEKYSPSYASPASLRTTMRLTGAIGLTGGFLYAYTESSRTSPPPSPLPTPIRTLRTQD